MAFVNPTPEKYTLEKQRPHVCFMEVIGSGYLKPYTVKQLQVDYPQQTCLSI